VACDVVLYCSLERRLGLFFFKSYVASYDYVRRPGTDRISEEVKKKLRRNSVIPVEKVPQERKTQESGGFLQEYAT
jgi:hypothetical protein